VDKLTDLRERMNNYDSQHACNDETDGKCVTVQSYIMETVLYDIHLYSVRVIHFDATEVVAGIAFYPPKVEFQRKAAMPGSRTKRLTTYQTKKNLRLLLRHATILSSSWCVTTTV
jgi:hypothetical protein